MTVSALAVLPGGEVVAGGSFRVAGGVLAGSIARYSPSTNTWSAVGTGVSGGAAGNVYSLAVLANGDLIVGGTFAFAGGVPASNIARYRPSTGSWSALGSALGSGVFGLTSARVSDLVVLPGGDVIVGGSFVTAGGVQASNIARFSPSTNTWSALGSGTSGPVSALTVLPGGDVIVGGSFDTAGGVQSSNIARYSPSTNAWSTLGDGVVGPSFAGVYSLTVLTDSDVIVGGSFDTAGGVQSSNIARYSPSTNTWSALGSGTSGPVSALTVLPGGDVIVGGRFGTAGGVPASNVARFSPGANAWSALGSGVVQPGSAQVSALAVLTGGDVILGGDFTSAGGVPARSIARHSPATGGGSDTWSALGSGTNDLVWELAVLPGGDVILGGDFATAGGVPANRIVRYSPSTTAWSPLGAGVSGPTSSQVSALAVLPDGGVIVGGTFATGGGVAVSNIALYSPSTGTWSAMGSGTSGPVYAAAVLASGDVVVGGSFATAGGVAVSNTALYSPSTGTWSALGAGTSGPVYAAAVLASGDVVVGGSFATAGGVAASNLARYSDPTGVGGGNWSGIGASVNGTTARQVNALAVLPGGDVLVGGGITATAGDVRNTSIARYSLSTGTLSAIASGTVGQVNSLAVLPGGDVIVGGTMSYGVSGVRSIARYAPTTNTWSALGSGVNGTVLALGTLPNGDVMAGGWFPIAGGNVSAYFARYSFNSACPADFDCSGVRDVADIFGFLVAWFAGAPSADIDASGVRDVADIFAFLSLWFAGC